MSVLDGHGRPPRMADVARHAGVSLGTVSHVLNHPQKVTEATRTRVLAAIAELGFVPDRRARALAAGTSDTVGFVVVDLSNSFFLDMARGAEREAQKLGLNVVLGDSDMQQEKQELYMALFENERLGGILLAPHPGGGLDDLLAKDRWTRPVVVLNMDAGPRRCYVTADDERGGYLAARHLIDTGRRRLLFVGGPERLDPVRNRRRGVTRAVQETEGAVSLDFIATSEVQAVNGRTAGSRIAAMSPGERPDGIVAAADLLALGIIQQMLAETDVRFGEDIGLIGYDNNRAAWDSVVPITTMAQPGEEMGRAAMRLLSEEIQDPEAHTHQHLVLEPSLIVRASSERSCAARGS